MVVSQSVSIDYLNKRLKLADSAAEAAGASPHMPATPHPPAQPCPGLQKGTTPWETHLCPPCTQWAQGLHPEPGPRDTLQAARCALEGAVAGSCGLSSGLFQEAQQW